MVNNPAFAYLTWVSLHRCVEIIFLLSTGHSTGSPRHVLVHWVPQTYVKKWGFLCNKSRE